MEMLSLIKIFFLNIKNYGIVPSIKIILFEIKGFITFKKIDEFKLVKDKNTSCIDSKFKIKYNFAYVPTPYYFLYLIKKNLDKKNIKKFNLIDFGCGYSRPASYFNKSFKIRYIGFDINKSIINLLPNKKNFRHYCLNLRNNKKIFKIINKFFKNKKNIFLFSDPFDIKLVNSILKQAYKKRLVFKVILINTKFKLINKKIFSLSYLVKFKNRNISIFEVKKR